MTDPCPSCGEVLEPDDERCPCCGTLAPPPAGTSVFAHETAEPRWADEPATAGDPLVIPVREPGEPRRRDRARTSARLPSPVLVGLVAVAALVLLAVLAARVLGGDGGDDVASGGDPASMSPADVVAEGTSSTTQEPSSTTTSSTTSSTTTTTTTAPPATGAGSVPVLPSSYGGGWVAQLSSVPASAGSSSVEAAYARIRSDVPGARAARSDEWPSMTPGYWVFVETGFGSEDAVRSFCSSVGRSGDACLPRQLAGRR